MKKAKFKKGDIVTNGDNVAEVIDVTRVFRNRKKINHVALRGIGRGYNYEENLTLVCAAEDRKDK